MATTRKTQAKAEQRRISQIGDFKKRLGGVIELPSGFIVRWRNPGGLRAFLSNGTIPNFLMPVVQRALNDKQGMKEDEVADMINDPDKLAEMMKLYDSVTMQLIIEPKIYPVPTEADVEANNQKYPDAQVDDPEELRYDDRLYIDEIPDDDKLFLFQLMTGGTKDLESFRKRQSINVDSVARVSGVSDSALGSDGANGG